MIWTSFCFPNPKEASHEIWLQSAEWLLRKRRLKIFNLKIWTKVNEWPWPLVLISFMNSFGWLHLILISKTSFWKFHCFTFFPYKSISNKIWPCHKISQGQHRFITWTNLVVLKYPCCKSTFKVIGLLVTERKNFSCVYHIWAWRPFWSCYLDHLNKLSFPIPYRIHIKFGFNRPSGFSGKEVWKCWIWVTLVQGQWMTLTFDKHTGSCTHLVNCIDQL